MRNFFKPQAVAAENFETAFTNLINAGDRYCQLGIDAARQVGGPSRANRDLRARLTFLLSRLQKSWQPPLRTLSACKQTLPQLCAAANEKLIRLGKTKEDSAMSRRQPAVKPTLSVEERIAAVEKALH